ncbi:spore germination protein [Haloimpatiens lingqiaonensis]|uniref:spore germination protein n=1 Tax=Haloimpatiens lingqiaonensis TaxID=1380675 RepID=UPI0010FD3771|nr:spore germination protein [Haloimpatiens lingqiaonensis]
MKKLLEKIKNNKKGKKNKQDDNNKEKKQINNKDSKTLKNVLEQYNLNKSLQKNIDLFQKDILKDDGTIIYRKFKNRNSSTEFCLIFIDGMVKSETINKSIIYPITTYNLNQNNKQGLNGGTEDLVQHISDEVIMVDDVKIVNSVDELIHNLLYGDSILFIDGYDKALIINTKGWDTRSIEEPSSETIVKGPREGFNESIIKNLSLIRRKINSPDLKFKFRELGVRSRTKICIAYVEGIANDKILRELEKRLDDINIDGIFSTAAIQECINDAPLSPFRTIGNTERPDVVASKLLQGRIALLCDGTPVVLTLPFLFIEYFQVNEDYYDQFIFASMNRVIRIIGFIITIITPGIYVAITTFHKELIPTELALSIYLAREGVPLPTVIESIVMLITFEIIREAGTRLPKHVGGAVSIVGALVLGDAAVNAKFVSAPMVIVVGVTGISGLIIYEMKAAIISLRFIFLIAASLFGIYGVIFVGMGLSIHLMSIKSFGIPYMLKIANMEKYTIVDTTIRMPWWLLKYRTKFISKDFIRMKNNIKEKE